MSSPVVTRIAPSPTGMMHIGTARTALFNKLYARHHAGRYLLRIEDTDRERSTEAAVGVILDGLAWLGLEPDEPPVFQHQRIDRHREVVMALLAAGRAYRCFMNPSEVALEREKARAAGTALRSPWRDRDPREGANEAHVIRFRGPLEGQTVVHDLVKGEVVFRNRDLDDLVLLRSDGGPTYNIAVVADDHDMAVSHVIRGDDHLTNTARQTLIYQAMEWALPAFGHLPMIHGPDGAKLSKRHGAQSVSEFADLGYLPEALRNYLARLGWGHGDDEIFSDEQAVAWFEIADVVSAPARLDWAKLGHVNNHYIRAADDGRLADLVLAHRERIGLATGAAARARLQRAISFTKEGAKTISQLEELVRFALDERPLALPANAADLLDAEAHARLARLADNMADWNDESPEALVGRLRAFAEAEGVGMGRWGPALRSALGGAAGAPDLASTIATLGRDESRARIGDALSHLQ